MKQTARVEVSPTGIAYAVSDDPLRMKLIRLLDMHNRARSSATSIKLLPGLQLAIEAVRHRIQGQQQRLAA